MNQGKKRSWIHIPQEIVEDILLLNLPVKSLMRFKAVSREWRKTIESKRFLERHIGIQKSLGSQLARILAISCETRTNLVAFDTMLFSTNGISHEISPYPPMTPLQYFGDSKISYPCDGLFGLYSDTDMSLLNPATTCCRNLPYPTNSISDDTRRNYTLLGIGRENMNERRRYKVVCYFKWGDEKVGESTKCMVFALDSTTWKAVDPPHDCRVKYEHSILHLDGVLYCFTHGGDTGSDRKKAKVLAFDLHTEKFQSFSISPYIGFTYSSGKSGIHVLNHRVCIFNNNDTLLRVWGLDINMRSWEMMHSIDFSDFHSSLERYRRIIPMATINNYVIITDYYYDFWGLYNYRDHTWHQTFSLRCTASFGMPYFETLVSPYQCNLFGT